MSNTPAVLDKSKYSPEVCGRVNEPQISRSAVEWLRKELSKRKYRYGLEWGMGASTPWLCERLEHLWSVEHSIKWYRRVRECMTSRRGLFKKWQGFLLPWGPIGEKGYLGQNDEGGYYDSYAQIVESLPALHLVMMDGRARDACLRHALKVLKSHGALLVYDNVDADKWHLDSIPSYWERIDCFDPPLYTSIWITSRRR